MTIRSALLGSTLAVAVALAGGSAFAADLSMPKPVKMAPAPASSTYVSVFGGLAIGGSLTGQMSSSESGIYDVNIALQHGFVIGGAVGTTLMPNLRGELELSYVHHGVNTDGAKYEGDTPTSAVGNYATLYALGNLWYDIDLGSGLTPYVGGGIGLAVLMPDFTVEEDDTYNKSAVAPAGQLGFGVKYAIADNMALDFGYRAKAVFNATLPGPNDEGTPEDITGLSHIDQTFTVGLSVGF